MKTLARPSPPAPFVNNPDRMKPEDRLVDRLRELFPPGEAVRLGIGDDAAVLRATDRETAVTTDSLVEGVDFLPGEDPYAIGRRAVSVNLSDLAAVGAKPRWFVLSVAFPRERGEDYVLALCRGAGVRGREHGASLCGGDLSTAPALFVSVTMAGELDGPPLLRSGARPGDALFLSGATGRAAAGLRLVAEGIPEGLSEKDASELLAAYRDPEPRVALGLALSRGKLATAAIDLSDGLGVDAGRLARASGLRAVVERERVPLSPALAAFCGLRGADAIELAVGGGDDYELLFAAPESSAREIDSLASIAPLTRVGRLEAGSGAVLRDRSGDREISGVGHDHFEAGR